MHYARPPALFPDSPEILWKSVDEGWVFYDPAAGTTLLLAPLARFVLDLLPADGSPLSLNRIVAAVRLEEPEAAEQECRDAVSAAVDALLDAHLICTAALDRQ